MIVTDQTIMISEAPGTHTDVSHRNLDSIIDNHTDVLKIVVDAIHSYEFMSDSDAFWRALRIEVCKIHDERLSRARKSVAASSGT